jgi:calcineurin-like phosphoesterase family protein
MHWYTADLHLNHEAIIRFCKRPYGSASEMDSRICDAICSTVGPDDDLWVVGDFAFARVEDREKIARRFAGLPGRKHLVLGNHDKAWVRALPWASQHEIAIVQDDDTFFVLCHYPMITWPHARHGAVQLFGHVHNNWRGSRNAVNVGVDVWGFAPVQRSDILRRARQMPVNAHWEDVEPRSDLEERSS